MKKTHPILSIYYKLTKSIKRRLLYRQKKVKEWVLTKGEKEELKKKIFKQINETK